LIEELQTTEQRIGESMRRLREITGKLAQQQQHLEALDEKQRLEQSALDIERGALARQMRAAYAMGRQERLKILLNQQDPAMVSRVLLYYDYFNRARMERMMAIEEALQRLRQTKQEIAAEEQRLRELESRELAEKERLDQTRGLRQQVISALASDIQNKGQKLSDMKKDEQQLQALVKRLQQELVNLPLDDDANSRPFGSLKGKLRWPTKGRLGASFGTPKSGGLKWDGVMISAPEGEEVKAVHHGRVAFADWLRGFGLLLIIDHGEGYMTLYGHNQSLFKETGEWVSQDEPVALVGNSGGRLNSGVYFGIRREGRPVNPKKWCRRTKGDRVGIRLNSIPGWRSIIEIETQMVGNV
jgi:septal ring factor EnvC (AmiA/AmiB activator)